MSGANRRHSIPRYIVQPKSKHQALDRGPMPAALAKGYERYLKIVLALPGTEASPRPRSGWRRNTRPFGTPSVRVCGKILSRWRTEAEGGLAIRCDFLDRQILLQSQPDVFFLTDHYVNYPMILVRIELASREVITDVTERAWRFIAPAKLVRQRDSAQTSMS